MNQKRYAVIQRGTVAYGIGDSREQAIENAVEWLEYEEDNGQKRPCKSAAEVESMLSDDNVSGALAVISSDNPEWSDYVK